MKPSLDAEIEALQAQIDQMPPYARERAGALWMLRKLRTKQLAQIAKLRRKRKAAA